MTQELIELSKNQLKISFSMVQTAYQDLDSFILSDLFASDLLSEVGFK